MKELVEQVMETEERQGGADRAPEGPPRIGRGRGGGFVSLPGATRLGWRRCSEPLSARFGPPAQEVTERTWSCCSAAQRRPRRNGGQRRSPSSPSCEPWSFSPRAGASWWT